MGHFKVKSKINLDEAPLGMIIEESDYAQLTPNGHFVQLEYVSEDTQASKVDLKPGTWSIDRDMSGLFLAKTSFTKDELLDSLINTKTVTDRIDRFFAKTHVYHKWGVEVPRRGIMLYGPAGSGKTSIIVKVSQKYLADEKTAVIIWPTDRFEACEVKELIKRIEYVGVERLVFIMEDLGGVEAENVEIPSQSSLLSLLDNQEKSFSIPTLILATTNFPEIFMGNLLNRPGRFDLKIEVGFLESVQRSILLSFFLRRDLTDSEKAIVEGKDAERFTPSHIKEVAIRAELEDITHEEAIKSIKKDLEDFDNNFKVKKSGMGIRTFRDD